MFKRNIMCQHLSYAIGNRALFSNLSLSLGDEKTGLVGSNGTGKTTLLRLLVGQLQPQTGTIHASGKIGYMPQNFVVDQDQSIAQVFGIDQKIAALEHMTAGVGDHNDVDIVGDDWDAITRAEAILHRCNLRDIALSRPIKTLSGGQTTRVYFARLLMNKSTFLVLDEPTNNLDSESRSALYDVIQNFDGGLLIVSHDRQLLSLMDQIMELSPLGLKTYGGNYTDYVEQKRIEQEALEQDIIDAQKQLHKTKKTVQLSKERYAQRVSMGNRIRRTGGQPKMFLDYHKGRAEVTKSKLEAKTDKQLASVKDKLATAQSMLEQRALLDFELEATRVHNTKLVLEIQNLTFAYPKEPAWFDTLAARPECQAKPDVSKDAASTHHERAICQTKTCNTLIKDFNLTLIGPERLALTGKNGSGKTTLLKLIMEQLMPTAGTIKVGVLHCAYLDQALSTLDTNQTILENFKRLNPEVKETDCRLRLAAFLFAHDDALKLAQNLSGGEKMRAVLACVLMGDTPPQLILLDEPTNNMDLESLASIERALRSYKGALIAVSHDAMFLQNIGVEEEVEMHAETIHD